MVFFILVLAFLMHIRSVLCCEAECMSGITEAFIQKYSEPIRQVFLELTTEISNNFFPDEEVPEDYLDPINNTLYLTAPSSYRYAIFPSYFHGKCQDPTTGINPEGCPNPRCPVVCGTPGSLVYHYSYLRMIVHNAVKSNYNNVTDPNSRAFSETLFRVLRTMRSKQMLRPSLRFPSAFNSEPYGMQDESSVNRTLRRILNKFSGHLDDQCGGYRKGSAATLPNCDWKQEMIPYILTFP